MLSYVSLSPQLFIAEGKFLMGIGLYSLHFELYASAFLTYNPDYYIPL